VTVTLILHSYFRSSCSWRVRIALAHKGLSYDYVPVHLLRDGGEQYLERHRRLNPMQQVPVLVDGETVIAQSMAILEYLEERHPRPTLLPGDARDRARIRQLAEIVNSGVQPLQNLRVMGRLRQQHGLDDAAVKAWSAHWIENGFQALERLTEKWSGSTCVGDQVSLADAYLVPQLYNARRFGVELSPFPTLLRVEAALTRLPAFVDSHPDNQPDTPAS
jgi:maleylpyruvate isomerase